MAIVDWATPIQLNCLRKKAISVAHNAGFRITIDIGHTKTDFLDISIDLANNIYKPQKELQNHVYKQRVEPPGSH